MRLIDAETYEQTLIANDWDKEIDGFSTEGVFELLGNAPTVQAVPLDRIKEARAEIFEAHKKHLLANGWSNIMIAVEIMDKLIAEVEGQKNE